MDLTTLRVSLKIAFLPDSGVSSVFNASGNPVAICNGDIVCGLWGLLCRSISF